MQSEGKQTLWNDVPTLLAAAHELKSPLVLIRQLALQLEDSSDNIQAERIRLTAERSLQLVDSLTKVARMEDTLFEVGPINMSELCDEIAHELNPLARALDQQIETLYSRRHAIAVGNRMLLRAVIFGLCDNALTHNNAGHPVLLSATQSGDRIISSVRDYGPTTPNIRTIRRNIGRSTQPITARPRSSGLGLLIAEQFARQMDSSLKLRRHHTAGITLSIDLPASKQLSLIGL